jgi:hypothetical protein
MAAAWAAALLWLAAPAAAAPDFSTTTIAASPAAPAEGDLVTFVITLRNTGPDAAEPAWMIVEWPAASYFTGVRGLEAPAIDHEAQSIEAYVALLPGAEHRVEVDVLTPRGSAGQTLTLALRVSYLSMGIDHRDRSSVSIDAHVSASGVRVGPAVVSPAGLAVLGWLVAGAAVWLIVSGVARARPARPSPRWRARHRNRAAAITLTLMVPVGFWIFFGAMAWRDYQSITSWQRTSCTVAGRRIVEQSVSSTGTGRNRPGTAVVYAPELALRYEVDDRVVHSAGYDTGSSLRVGGRSRREAEVRDWTIGSVIPCWYNPADPQDVVVRPGFGGAYVFALLPLPIFVYGCVMLWRQ